MMSSNRSLLGRLSLIFAATVAAYVAVAALVISQVTAEHPRNQFSQHLLAHILRGVGPEQAGRLAADLEVEILRLGPDGPWWSHPGLPAPELLRASAPAEADFAFFLHDGRRFALLRQDGVIWFLTGFKSPLSPWAIGMLVGGALAVLLVAWGNWRLTRWLVAPLPSVRAAADRIAGGDLDHRIPETGRSDELSDLTRAINIMAARIQAMLDAKRELLLAIGHEVRSPLARARVLLEMLPPAPQTPRLRAALADIDRITTALLEAEALAGAPHRALAVEAVSLREVVAEAVDACGADGRLMLELPPGDEPALLHGDRMRLGVLVRNLIGNALTHGGTGPVMVTLAAATPLSAAAAPAAGPVAVPGWCLTVRDSGPGVPPEHLARLGDAFYRPDPSRQRGTGGHGLGLHLCRRIVEAHGGVLTLTSPPGTGLTAAAVLPVEPAA